MSRLREKLRFKNWGKWIIVGGIGMAVMSTVSVEITSTASFCNSCHIMEPYYSSWTHSPHKDIQCIKCHITPGVDNFVSAKLNGLGQVVDDVLHRTSTKPSASVSQLSCTRGGCHSVEKLDKKESKSGIFKFDHAKHIGAKVLGVEISCGTCHSHVKGDEHFEVNTPVCVTCHLLDGATSETMKEGKRQLQVIHLNVRDSKDVKAAPDGSKRPPSACTTCHNPPKGEIQFQGLKFDHAQFLAFGATCESCHRGVTATPPPIDDGRCLECHTFGVEKSLPSAEMHKVHTEGSHKIECSSCHGAIRHGPQVQTVSVEKFDCTRCHIDQHNVQRQTYFNVNPSTHSGDGVNPVSPMFLAHVDCTGCHTQQRAVSVKPGSLASVMAASSKSCDACHQAGLGERMIPLWQKTTHNLYDQILAETTAAEGQGATGEQLKEVKKLLNLVSVDGSWGVHNPRYTQQLLEQARGMLSDLRKAQGTTK